MSNNKKNSNSVVIISAIISFIVGMTFFVIAMIECNVKIETLIKSFIALVIGFPTVWYTIKYLQKKDDLVNEIFILDVFNKINNQHIRITAKNLLFKYKVVIRFLGIFPRGASYLSLGGNTWNMTTYSIKNKTQLTTQEIERIVEMINNLEDTIEWDVVVNYKGKKKYVHSYQINQIFEQYNIGI